ncbi:MAG: hypothetical protein ABJG88_08670 [Litorimonas sp.]
MNHDEYAAARRKTPIWVWIIIAPFMLILTFAFAFGIMTTTGVFPSTEVQTGDELPKKQLAALFEAKIILEGETIEYFYSEGLFSVLEGGNILTTDTVISYTKDEKDELFIYDIDVDEVVKIEEIEKGDYLTDAIYRIHEGNKEENWLEIWLSTENGGHLKFMNALEAKAFPDIK